MTEITSQGKADHMMGLGTSIGDIPTRPEDYRLDVGCEEWKECISLRTLCCDERTVWFGCIEVGQGTLGIVSHMRVGTLASVIGVTAAQLHRS